VFVVVREVAWVKVTDRGASTVKVSSGTPPGLRVLCGSVVVVAAGVAALATSTAVTVGWVAPVAWVMGPPEHVSVGLAAVQEEEVRGAGKPLMAGNV
jgi:hypothetical protein